MFVVGIIIAAAFIFFDWYVFQAVDQNGTIVVYWSYNPIFSWYTIFEEGSVFNELYTPTAEPLPFMLIVCFLVSLGLALIGMMYRTPHRILAYINIFSVLLIGFFIFIYPIMYLIPYQYYFPWISFYDPSLDVTFQYTMQIGYIMEGISFILLFPYTIYYYRKVLSLEQESHSPEGILDKYIQKLQEPIDLDKFIQEEELELARNKISIKNNKIIKKEKSVVKT